MGEDEGELEPEARVRLGVVEGVREATGEGVREAVGVVAGAASSVLFAAAHAAALHTILRMARLVVLKESATQMLPSGAAETALKEKVG